MKALAIQDLTRLESRDSQEPRKSEPSHALQWQKSGVCVT